MHHLQNFHIAVVHRKSRVHHGDLPLTAYIPLGHLHDAGAHRGHLGPVVGADDGSHHVAAEGGTGHLQVAVGGVQLLDAFLRQRGSRTQIALVLLHIHIQTGAVGGQAGVDASGNTGCHIAADGAGAEQHNVGRIAADHILHALDIGLGGVLGQHGMIQHQHLVRAILAQHVGLVGDVVAHENGHHRLAQIGGQPGGLADQLKADFLDAAAPLLNKYENILAHLLSLLSDDMALDQLVHNGRHGLVGAETLQHRARRLGLLAEGHEHVGGRTLQADPLRIQRILQVVEAPHRNILLIGVHDTPGGHVPGLVQLGQRRHQTGQLHL